jgi:flagellar protein FliS
MWKDAYLESRVLSADPIELICMLYERALILVSSARVSLAAGDVPARCHAISQTLAILSELESSLNHEAGGQISKELRRLYQHMRTRLLTANLKRQDAPLAEVHALLTTLGEAWEGIRPQASAAADGAAHREAAACAGASAADRWGGSSPVETGAAHSGHDWKA